jgi:hypothetical protein
MSFELGRDVGRREERKPLGRLPKWQLGGPPASRRQQTGGHHARKTGLYAKEGGSLRQRL